MDPPVDVNTGWHSVDTGLTQWVYGFDVPTPASEAITHLVTRGGAVVVVAVVMLALGRGRTRRAGAALAAGLLAHVLLLEGVVKNVVQRKRPFTALGLTLRDSLVDPASFSFPSGHSAAAFLGAWVIGARYPRHRAPLIVLACCVALSRVHLGAHYPTDVAAGAVFGVVLGAALVRVARVAAPVDEARCHGHSPIPAPE